ncbi:MAG TPA: UDP-N-acetylmuramoyl-L-alanine--D-glutamate ligase [Micromonosporaceae bacterium]|nr:UDP-N-acetylmuramoyl-L-alanine--D-glutamate ligase [Micromonosporaceae bacterium]
MRRYQGRAVLIAGAGIAGVACAEALLGLGADVTVIDRHDSDRLAALARLGARILVAEVPDDATLRRVTDVVVSPGFPPDHPLPMAALAAGLEVYSEPELAWRLRRPGRSGEPPRWLAVTGTNGKTTTVTMLAEILTAAGYRTAALGNVGEPLVDAMLRPPEEQYDVIAVELSSFQLHWSSRLAPWAGALLNLAEDHLDWHGGFDAYARTKTQIWRAARAGHGVAVGNLDDPRVAALLSRLPGPPVGFSLAEPTLGQLGLAADALIDHAFSADPVVLLPAGGLHLAGRHNLANALAAAALARAYGVTPDAVRIGLGDYRPQRHRNTLVATVAGVTYVDDSKATNPHAAQSSLTAYPRVVWIAGGQLKGVDVDHLVGTVAARLVGVVLIGADRARIIEALRRHAPEVPVRDIERTDDGAMVEAVRVAADLASPGDTVLLAPAAASFDMFAGYADRGDRFAAVVSQLSAVQG